MHDEQFQFILFLNFVPLMLPSSFHLDQISRLCEWMQNVRQFVQKLHFNANLKYSSHYITFLLSRLQNAVQIFDINTKCKLKTYTWSIGISSCHWISTFKCSTWEKLKIMKILIERKSHCMISHCIDTTKDWREEAKINKENKMGKFNLMLMGKEWKADGFNIFNTEDNQE